eukprot:TRINITY_DN11700_c0_g1_i3.p1 TRINITY_DN11700_c0_g1~~TRINITY_DN11700_c0_g1_i3.p1  ORF type:complete len:156 (+),score=67.62 TRINITY_DN11700_c0_g1_i3:99-566(+)
MLFSYFFRFFFFFFKQKTAYEMLRSLVGSEMCIRDRCMAQTEEEKVVSERKFKAVSEAYSVLMNAEKRREYDMKVDRERYTSSAYGGAGYGSSAFSGAGAYRSSTTTSSSTAGAGGAGAGAYRSGASRWSKYGAGAGAAGGPGTAGAGGTTGGFW